MKKSNKQSGFGSMEIVMIVIVIALITIVGWLLWQNVIKSSEPTVDSEATDSKAASTSIQLRTPPTAPQASNQPAQ